MTIILWEYYSNGSKRLIMNESGRKLFFYDDGSGDVTKRLRHVAKRVIKRKDGESSC
jgi:hypothetical protein